MKRFAIAILALGLLASPAFAAGRSSKDLPKKSQAIEYGLFNHLSLGVSVGVMDAAGIEIAAPIIPQIQVRGGLSFLPVKGVHLQTVTIPAWGTHPEGQADIKGDFSWLNGNVLVDYFPFKKSSFHVTAGVFIGGATLVTAHGYFGDPTYQNAGIDYFADGDNTNKSAANVYTISTDKDSHLALNAKTGVVRPFVGIGFGRTVPNKRVSVSFDLGLEYTGGIKLFANGHLSGQPDVPVQITSEGLRAVVNEMKGENGTELYDNFGIFKDGAINTLASLPILPVLRLSVFFRLF